MNRERTENSLGRSRRKDRRPTEAAINRVYASYPTTDQNNDNRSTGKSERDKVKIRRILSEKKYPLHRAIKFYVRDCKAKGEWLKNFGTLLNNLPGRDLLDTWARQHAPRPSPVSAVPKPSPEDLGTEDDRRQGALEAAKAFRVLTGRSAAE